MAQPADDGEQVLAWWSANRTQGRRAVGGALFLTDARLVFCPSRLDHGLGGRAWTSDLREVGGVDVCPRTGTLFDGGLVDRLRVHLRTAAAELYVVRDPAEVAHVVLRQVSLVSTGLDGPSQTLQGRGGGPGRRLVELRVRSGRAGAGQVADAAPDSRSG